MTTKYSEMADAEELRAEAEEPDDDDEETNDEPDDEELDEEEQEAAGPTPEALKRFEAENTRHEKALAKVVGDDWKDFAPCDTCGGVGHLPAAQNKSLPFEHDPSAEVCPVCNGYGTTLTGAKEPGMVTRPCSRCTGSGWLTVAEQPQVQPLADPAAFAAVAAPLEPPNGAPVDPRVQVLRDAGYIILDPPVIAPPAGS